MSDARAKEELFDFFNRSVRFLANFPVSEESTFKEAFHQSHSDWLDIARAPSGKYPISADLLKELEVLFDKARTYFMCVCGSEDDYFSAKQKHVKLREEIKQNAEEILKQRSSICSGGNPIC